VANELHEKTLRIAAMLQREGLDAVILNAQHNFAWLTGGGSNGIDLSRENGAVSLLVSADAQRFVLANSIEMPRMLAEEVLETDFEPVAFGWQDEKSQGDIVLKRVFERLGDGARIATDIALFADVTPIEAKVAACRYQLTLDELDRYRTLGRDAGAAARRVIDKLNAGDTEIAIAEKMRHELALGGMTSVVTLVAADDRISQFRHPVPTANQWEKLLLIVTCARRNGMIVSLSRLVCIGEIPDDLRRKTDAAAFVNASLYDATRPGTTGAELYAAAASSYFEKGHGAEINLHHQGGAAGYKTRDWVAHPYSREVVQPNQAFAWNPSIRGTKVEETCIVGDNGVEVITTSPDFPKIPTMVNGREYFSPGILSI
jgi:antitoxin VapB